VTLEGLAHKVVILEALLLQPLIAHKARRGLRAMRGYGASWALAAGALGILGAAVALLSAYLQWPYHKDGFLFSPSVVGTPTAVIGFAAQLSFVVGGFAGRSARRELSEAEEPPTGSAAARLARRVALLLALLVPPTALTLLKPVPRDLGLEEATDLIRKAERESADRAWEIIAIKAITKERDTRVTVIYTWRWVAASLRKSDADAYTRGPGENTHRVGDALAAAGRVYEARATTYRSYPIGWYLVYEPGRGLSLRYDSGWNLSLYEHRGTWRGGLIHH
jgi:hypothetical protein